MRIELDLKELPSFSKLFHDFIAKDSNIMEFYPNNFVSPKKLKEDIIHNYSNRANLKKLIENSCNAIELNNLQKQNIAHLEFQDSLSIITGQQPGIYGGPIYSLLKAYSAINYAEKISNQIGSKVIPIFWVEDNDHDLEEVSKTYIYDQNYKIVNLKLFDNIPHFQNLPISEYEFEKEIIEINRIIENTLPTKLHKDESISIIKKSYKEGYKVADSFILFLNELLAERGILFVKSSEIRKSGMIKEVLLTNIDKLDLVNQELQDRGKILLHRGYNLQAKYSKLNFFVHHKGGRVAADEFQINELIDIPQDYVSTKALIRPIVQEYVFPNIAYVGGPGEIAYWSQMTGLYKIFGISQPMLLSRHFAGFLDNNSNRFLSDKFIPPQFFYRDFAEIERDLGKSFVQPEEIELFNNARSDIELAFDKIKEQIVKLEVTLAYSTESSKTKAMKQINRLEKKFISAHKKLRKETVEKYRQINNLLFPKKSYQDRTYSSLNLIAETGIENLRLKLEEICSREPGKFYIEKLL